MFKVAAGQRDREGPTNFIPAAADSQCITILLNQLHVTLYRRHVHSDCSFWISQTPAEPEIHLKKVTLVPEQLQYTASTEKNAPINVFVIKEQINTGRIIEF